MKNIFIVGNPEKQGSEAAAYKLESILKGKANIVGINLNKKIKIPKKSIDLVISLGGDGSFLNLVESVTERNLPIMGVNFGRLGFLTAGLENELENLMNEYIKGEMMIYERNVLKMNLETKAGLLQKVALNDVVVASPDLSQITNLYVIVSEEPLFHMRGDGLIISTPTGSTAHSLSAGGSLVDPRVEAILLTPLSPQSLSSRPLIVRKSAHIVVGVKDEIDRADILMDGMRVGELEKNQKLHVYTSEKVVKMVQPKNFRFFQRLSEKLGWTVDSDKEDG